MEIWSRPWLGNDEITLTCDGEEALTTAAAAARVTRGTGATTDIDVTDEKLIARVESGLVQLTGISAENTYQ